MIHWENKMNLLIAYLMHDSMLRWTARALVLATIWIGVLGRAETVVECPAIDAPKHAGELVIVTDVVRSVVTSSSHQVVITLGTTPSVGQNLTVLIPPTLAASLPDPQIYNARIISVLGRIVLRGKRPELVVISLPAVIAKTPFHAPYDRFVCPGGSPF